MDDATVGKLQIYSVEERGVSSATCIIRCIGGVVHTGEHFSIESDTPPNAAMAPIILDWINRYEQLVDFIDPPHSAKVQLSGKAVVGLERGVTLASIGADDS
ncbi:hypothetical protein QFZ76_006486 [Streptomyces sp. V4I2]|nr:hypothetical protein [Streptomyces sp. V4I2]